MAEPMSVWVEVWPVAADEVGIWLISGNDAWRPTLPVMADSEPHSDVELELAVREATSSVVLLHSTSWRVDRHGTVLTYMALLKPRALVLDEWPDALPISHELPGAVGKPPTSAPTDPPAPRYVDVLMHGLRHLKFLTTEDATASHAMGRWWPKHLEKFTPALATMYDQVHDAV